MAHALLSAINTHLLLCLCNKMCLATCLCKQWCKACSAVLCSQSFFVQAMTPQPGRFGQHLLKGFAALWNDR